MKPFITVEELYLLSKNSNAVEIPVLKDVVPYLSRSPGVNGKTLAHLLKVKRGVLSNAIQLLTGVTLNDLLKEWKLLHAMYLLRHTAFSYDDVAKLCGFSGNRTLSRFLERNIKCSAYEYRMGKSNGHKGIR